MINPLKTKSEMLGKAYAHGKSWQEAYADLLPQEFLKNTYTLKRCQNWVRLRYPQNILIVCDGMIRSLALPVRLIYSGGFARGRGALRPLCLGGLL